MLIKNFIKMCEKAGEIQREWKPKIGDRIIQKNLKTDMVFYVNEKNIDYDYCTKYTKDEYIYLPTQEQLQKIGMTLESLKGRVMKPFWELLDQFSYFLWDDETRKYASEFESLNELWLAFIIKEKYYKLWSIAGQRWVKANE